MVDSIKNTAAELAATIDRKLLHREQFKKLEKRNFYSQILCPQEANGALMGLGGSNNVKLKEEQEAAIKRMYDIDTYMTKSNKR